MELVERTNQQLSFFQHDAWILMRHMWYIILNFPFEIFCFQMFTNVSNYWLEEDNLLIISFEK